MAVQTFDRSLPRGKVNSARQCHNLIITIILLYGLYIIWGYRWDLGPQATESVRLYIITADIKFQYTYYMIGYIFNIIISYVVFSSFSLYA